MNEFFNDLQQEARKIKLSTQEKQSMRVHLYKVMDENPAYSAAQKNAVEEFASRKVAPVPSMFYWFSPRFSVPMAVFLLVGLSGGTAFAAQSALPGDPLYAIKVNVNEQVQTALATTPQAKAQVNATIATTRLEEAETLASIGKLDAPTTLALASNFAAHADAVHANTDAVAVQDPGSAAQLAVTFSSTLAAHGAILAQIGTDSGTTSVRESSDNLALQVLAHVERGQRDREQTNDSNDNAHTGSTTLAIAVATPVSGGSSDNDSPQGGRVRTFAVTATQALKVSSDDQGEATTTNVDSAMVSDQNISAETHNSEASNKKSDSKSTNESTEGQNQDDGVVALALQTQASTTFAIAQTDFALLAPSLNATTSAQVQSKLNTLQLMLTDGTAQLEAGNNGSAKSTFNKVLQMSVRLDAFLKAGKKFDGNLLTSLLSQSVHDDK